MHIIPNRYSIQPFQVSAAAWTGIASTLLAGGQTLHTLFKLPVPIVETSTCNISPASKAAQQLRETQLFIIDEASMVPANALHAIDMVMRDIMGIELPFGGKLFLLGGDFRQVLPVVPHGTPTSIIENCIKSSNLWPQFKFFRLTKNMRAGEGQEEFAALHGWFNLPMAS